MKEWIGEFFEGEEEYQFPVFVGAIWLETRGFEHGNGGISVGIWKLEFGYWGLKGGYFWTLI
jgi:hypothetical protein